MGNNVQELLDMLYAQIEDAYQVPLGAGRCIIEKDRVLELLNEIRAQLPAELSEARKVLAARSETLNKAMREAETIKKTADEYAKKLVEREEIVRQARAKANSLVASAEAKTAELRRVANDYADDTLRRTEEAISEAINEVRQARARFKSVSSAITGAQPQPQQMMQDPMQQQPPQRQRSAIQDLDLDIDF